MLVKDHLHIMVTSVWTFVAAMCTLRVYKWRYRSGICEMECSCSAFLDGHGECEEMGSCWSCGGGVRLFSHSCMSVETVRLRFVGVKVSRPGH